MLSSASHSTYDSCHLQAAKELEAAETAKKEAKKEAGTKAAFEAEGKKEADGSKLTKTNSSPKQAPKSGDTPKAEAGKGPDQAAQEGSNDDDESTPRDAEGNELEVDIDTSKLTAAQLQEELTKRGLDVKWQPLKGKKVLVERLQVTLRPLYHAPFYIMSLIHLTLLVTALTHFPSHLFPSE